MMKSFLVKVLCVSSALIFVACGAEDETSSLKHSTRYNMFSSIDHLAIVSSIDLLSIIEKSGFESNKNIPIEASAGYKMMVKDKLDAEVTGIDLTGNNHFAVSILDPEKPEFVMFTAKITNPENAKGTIKDLLKGKYTKEQTDGREYEFVVEESIAVAWDDKDVVLVFSEKNDPKQVALELLQARFVDGPDADNGLEAYLESKADMNVYARLENSIGVLENEGTNLPEELKEGLKDAFYVGAGNFNNGDITFTWDIHAEKIKNSHFNALAAQSVHASFAKYLTNDKLIAYATASINMSAIFHTLEMIPSKEFNFEKIEDEIGISKKEMEQLFTGEFAISFVDITQEEILLESPFDEADDFFEEDVYTDDKPVLIMTIGVSDTATLGGLLRKTGEVTTANGVYKMDSDAFIAFQQDKLVLTSDHAIAEFFASGKTYNAYVLPAGVQHDSPLFGYVNTDLNQLPNGLLKMAETEEGQMGLQFLGLFESVQFNGEFEHMEFKASMKNKTENSLKVITDFIAERIANSKMI